MPVFGELCERVRESERRGTHPGVGGAAVLDIQVRAGAELTHYCGFHTERRAGTEAKDLARQG